MATATESHADTRHCARSRKAHDDHLVPGHVAQLQPPIARFPIRLHENQNTNTRRPRPPFCGLDRKISVLCRVRLMCMAVTRRRQSAVKGALSIASQYPSQRVS